MHISYLISQNFNYVSLQVWCLSLTLQAYAVIISIIRANLARSDLGRELVDGRDVQVLQVLLSKSLFAEKFADDGLFSIEGRVSNRPFTIVFNKSETETGEWSDEQSDVIYMTRSVDQFFFNNKRVRDSALVGFCPASGSVKVWGVKNGLIAEYSEVTEMRTYI